MSNTITLDTPLADIDWDNASDIGEDLIDLERAGGDDWGQEWSQVLRAGGTVRDLRNTLYERTADSE